MKTNDHVRVPSESLVLNFTPSDDFRSFKPNSKYVQPKTKKERNNNNKPDRTHYKSNSLTVGGYGLYNVWSDGDVTADEEEYEDDSLSVTPQPAQYNPQKNTKTITKMNENTNTITKVNENTNTITKVNENTTNNTLATQIVLATPHNQNNEKHEKAVGIKVESFILAETNKKNNSYKNNIHTTLHYLGLLCFSHLISKDENITHYTDLLKVFSEMRACVNKYYSISENKIFKEIESFILPENTKANTLSNSWYDSVDGQCIKNLFIFPVMFGWIELILIIYINIIFILIIFEYNSELYYLKQTLYNLSLSLVIITGLHCIGITYQKILSINKWQLKILKKYKQQFIALDKVFKHQLNEKYISLQKWFNCLIVTANENYTGHFIRFFIDKYVFLLLISVGLFCILHLLHWNQRNIARKIEKFYIVFELIIFPLWWIFVVFGIKKCFQDKIWKSKCFIALLLYLILFCILCIHSYSHIKFFDHIKFFETETLQFTVKIILFICLVILNPFLLIFLLWKLKISFIKNKYSKYYMINMLLIYLCITIKLFIDTNIITNTKTLQLVQNIFHIIIYCLISVSNIIYVTAINIKYFENNRIVISRPFIFSFWSCFLCNYKIENFCYETDWSFEKDIVQPIVTNDIDDIDDIDDHDDEIIDIHNQLENIWSIEDTNNEFINDKQTVITENNGVNNNMHYL